MTGLILPNRTSIENQIRSFSSKKFQWILIRLCILSQILLHQNQILQDIVFKFQQQISIANRLVRQSLSFIRNKNSKSFFRALTCCQAFLTKNIEFIPIGHRSLNSTSGYVTHISYKKRQNRIYTI